MKKINIMLHTEVVECLRPLDDETLASIMRMIFDWNDGIEVKPITQVEKFAWALILPKLERNKETYGIKVETAKENGKKGGAPVGNQNASKNKTTENNLHTTQNNLKQTNLNYNLIDSSKEESYKDREDGKHEPVEAGSVSEEPVSKGLESLEKIFPPRKNDIGIDEINLWNSLSQQNKKTMIQRASMYIRNENKKDDGKFIKKIGKWMREQIEKGFEESTPSMKNSTNSTDPRLLKLVDGQVYSTILSKVSDSTGKADKIYHQLNRKDIFNDKKELLNFVQSMDKEEINNLLN